MPINVELGCFAAYSDAFESQYPDFSEYPELDHPTYDNGQDKEWKDMSIEEICHVLSQYGMLVASEIKALGVNVMLAEYGYANETGLASGAFSSWNNKVHGYELNDEDEARFLTELIRWGKNNGMAGIHPWACEYDWAMP